MSSMVLFQTPFPNCAVILENQQPHDQGSDEI